MSTLVELPLRAVLEQQEELPRFGYFLTSGMASVVVELSQGNTVEVGLIAAEGVAGTSALLGAALSTTRCFMQIAGSGYRIPLEDLKSTFLHDDEFRRRVLQCVQQQFLTTSQLAACGQLHEVEPRLARWLLMVQDRVGDDVAHITHEFLAQMMGVHRPTITSALGLLQRAGLLELKRGSLRVVSKERLAQVACDCYPVTRRLLQGLY